jgi:hypothetical protein
MNVSKPTISTQVVTIKTNIKFDNFENEPKGGITEVAGYKGPSKTASLRWTKETGWIGTKTGISKLVIKASQTAVLKKTTIDILGSGNYETMLKTCINNGFVPESALHHKAGYKNINGIFHVNKTFVLKDLAKELRTLPITSSVTYSPELKFGIPAVVLKLKTPKWTYQIFENGTVLFSGLKDPSEIDEARNVFISFFDTIPAIFVMGPKVKPQVEKKSKLANRYPLAGTWNALIKPPVGFYIRPGTNGKPRLYKYRKMIKHPQTSEWLNHGPMVLSAVAPKVVKAFQNIGKNIPQSTLNAFSKAGYPLKMKPVTVVKKDNRRAPSWNATKPGFYVRPGPGHQPYWFKEPKGKAAAKKTIIAAYKAAGRNVPAAVRSMFGITENINVTKKVHDIVMGINGMIRINGQQASRFKKAQLLTIARNMNIPEANSSMKPIDLVKLIQNKAGVKGSGNMTYNILMNGVYYKFLNNGRLEKTKSNKQGFAKRTVGKWSTFKNKNKLAKAYLPPALHNGYKYSTILNYKKSIVKKAVSPVSSASSASSLGNFAANLEAEMKNQQYRDKYRNVAGNYYRNNNANKLVNRIKKLPPKASVNRAIKVFAKEAVAKLKKNIIETNFKSKITIPKWLPLNKANSYRNTLTKIALQMNNKGKYPSKTKVQAAMKTWANTQHGYAAYNKENMITGEIIHVPAWNPPKRKPINVPTKKKL